MLNHFIGRLLICGWIISRLVTPVSGESQPDHRDRINAENHWAFIPPRRLPLPHVGKTSWPRNAIDYFVLARMEQHGLVPSPVADGTTLIRRVALDITGLPPTLQEIDDLLRSQSLRDTDYSSLIERLLGSPHYGERMARQWLDVSRYADTNGHNSDSGRSMWPWRDWVVRAFNENKPYDEFLVEQIAGDLLPNASLQQKIATGFNRNHIINHEGGNFIEEYRIENVVDRVHTTATVFMGLTMKCARCHEHKYDPISQPEFYRFAAYFNNVAEVGQVGPQVNDSTSITRWLSFMEPLLELPDAQQRTKLNSLRQRLRQLEDNPEKTDEENQELGELRVQRDKLYRSTTMALVMEDLPEPRQAFVLVRGQYDQHGEKVNADVPSIFPPLPKHAPPNRLGLAQWLVDASHPLTARVAVNRIWQSYFGVGLVKTTEDFGIQGDPPSHPLLLDWLATELIRNGWNVKAIQKLIFNSATYRQSSQVTAEAHARDPENRHLTRGPRYRMSGEMIRDTALAVSGLLNHRMGGPSVRPYQPAGLWKEVDGLTELAGVYQQDHGGALFRRTVYTYWKRGSPPPALMVFDAPVRETCAMRRSRTNTPLQSLVLLNDPTYVEAARGLAERVLNQSDLTPEARITLAFRLATARPPQSAERDVLLSVFNVQLARFRENQSAAVELVQVGESVPNQQLDTQELAAWTTVASIILNLDETITKR